MHHLNYFVRVLARSPERLKDLTFDLECNMEVRKQEWQESDQTLFPSSQRIHVKPHRNNHNRFLSTRIHRSYAANASTAEGLPCPLNSVPAL